MNKEVVVDAILKVAQRIETPEVEGKLLRIASTIMDGSDSMPDGFSDFLAEFGIEDN
jgi:hypothetical protein